MDVHVDADEPRSVAWSWRVHIGAMPSASCLTTRPGAATSTGRRLAVRISTAACRVVSPASKDGLVKMQPREPNQ